MWSRSSHLYTGAIGPLALTIALSLAGAAQELEISVSPSPVGSGARAAGMADAFVAIADDATAASWNPAGLVQLERPEVSAVGSYTGVGETFDAPDHDEVRSSHFTGNPALNYLSFVYPLPVAVFDRNLVVSANYQRKYDFTRKFNLQLNNASIVSSSLILRSALANTFEQTGGLSTITPAFAMEINKRLSVGMALNLWRSSPFGENGWEQTTRFDDETHFGLTDYKTSSYTHEQYKDFTGENLTLGALWNVSDGWSLGLRFDTAFTGQADYRMNSMRVSSQLPALSMAAMTAETTDEKRRVRFPYSAAIGAAFRPNDRLTLSLDVTRTDWNDFWVENGKGVRRSLVDFSNVDDPSESTHFDPCYTVRLGTEYVFIPENPHEELAQLWTIRGGLFYDPEPATGKSGVPGEKGSGNPDPFYGAAIGVGVQLHQRVNLDLAYQCRYGSHVNSDFIRGLKGFSEDVLQHRVLLSTVIYF